MWRQAEAASLPLKLTNEHAVGLIHTQNNSSRSAQRQMRALVSAQCCKDDVFCGITLVQSS